MRTQCEPGAVNDKLEPNQYLAMIKLHVVYQNIFDGIPFLLLKSKKKCIKRYTVMGVDPPWPILRGFHKSFLGQYGESKRIIFERIPAGPFRFHWYRDTFPKPHRSAPMCRRGFYQLYRRFHEAVEGLGGDIQAPRVPLAYRPGSA